MTNRNAAILLILIVLAAGALSFAVIFQQVGAPQGQGRLIIEAYYSRSSGNGEFTGGYLVIFVTINGPLNTSGWTSSDQWYPLTLQLPPGNYTVSGTYNNGTLPIFKSENVTVRAGMTSWAELSFGNGPPPP